MVVGFVFRLTGTMTVAWVTVETTATHIDRTKTVESALGIGVVVFLKEILTFIEGHHHVRILHSFRGLLEGRSGVDGSSAEQSTGIVIFRVVSDCRITYFPRGGINGVITAGTSDSDEGTKQHTTNKR